MHRGRDETLASMPVEKVRKRQNQAAGPYGVCADIAGTSIVAADHTRRHLRQQSGH
jgi:hypothetical protein